MYPDILKISYCEDSMEDYALSNESNSCEQKFFTSVLSHRLSFLGESNFPDSISSQLIEE